MRQAMRRAQPLAVLLLIALLEACAPAAAPAPVPAGPVTPATAPAAAGPEAPTRPELVTAPPVDLKVGVQPTANFAPYFIAQERGYFREVGLNIEFTVTASVNEMLPSLAQGQLHVGACSSNVACFNFLNRRTDLQIVADLQSAGKTEKSIGNNSLVVRKDLWDAGIIREPRDLVGRTVYVIVGPGSGQHGLVARWLRGLGIDPLSVEFMGLSFPDQLAAMQNRAIEVGFQVEPLLTAGLTRGIHQIMATQEDMNPATQILFAMVWTGIERLGPMVGERFLVAYLRGARDYLNAFEYGVDQEAIIQILTEHTVIKDPAVYRQIRYSWIDPNGVVNQTALEEDAQLFRELGVITTPIDLSQAFNDRYRQFAVQYLGEYRPP